LASADDLDEDWDLLAKLQDGPVFHRLAFLRAYEHHPVQPVSGCCYLEVRRDNGVLAAAAPLYRQGDPLGLLGLAPGDDGLLSSMWHCSDTRLLAVDDDALDELVEAFAAEAAQRGCRLWGFINLDADGPAARALERRRFETRELAPRWRLTRSAAPDGETYLARLRRPARHELRRQLRRGAEHGTHLVLHDANYSELVGLLELVAATATRAGSSRYYDPARLAAFLRELGGAVRVLEVRGSTEETLAVGVCFAEGRRLQYWAAGYVRDRPKLSFSPYYVLWWYVLEMMWAAEYDVLECGRLNERFKRKMGLLPQPLVGMMGPAW
jgi:predicted N-acyltransferase